jgi:small GTP-binding protein
MSTKVIFVGNANVGKTSIVQRKINNTFNSVAHSTIGAALNLFEKDGKKIEIWDTAGQERYRSLIKIYFRGARIAVIVYDATDKNKIKSIDNWLKIVKDNDINEIIIVGSKCDLNFRDDVLTHYPHILVSSKNNINIDTLFDLIVTKSCNLVKFETLQDKDIVKLNYKQHLLNKVKSCIYI